MFAHDLCHSQIEYLSNSIDFNRKDSAKRYHKTSIFNRQYSIPACPGWELRDSGIKSNKIFPIPQSLNSEFLN
jgi:hypothetical protein